MSIKQRRTTIETIGVPFGLFLIVLIKIYRTFISPMLGQNCRFQPTCSQYAMKAIKIHGPIKGVFLCVKRITKCHPLHKGGYDPVPKAVSKRNN